MVFCRAKLDVVVFLEGSENRGDFVLGLTLWDSWTVLLEGVRFFDVETARLAKRTLVVWSML